jgi:SAM-dependent methyltransferase
VSEHDQALTREFDRWAQDGVDQAMERGHGRFTERALQAWSLGPGSRVLDVGCGNGWTVRRMMALGAGEGVGVDISAEMVALAQPPGRYLQASADQLPFPDARFSHVISVEALYWENPCHRIWQPLVPFPVQIRGEAAWAAAIESCGWRGCAYRRILDPRGVRSEEQFEPNPWAPSYADYLAEKQAGTLCLEASRPK